MPTYRHTLTIVLAGLALLYASGCATYSDKMKKATELVQQGDYPGGIKAVDKVMKVDSPDTLPDDWGSEQALAVLERATLKQALEEWKSSSVDFGEADRELDYIDLSGDAVGEIGKYIYSDSATKYRASATEKLSLNAFNMINYLSQGDTSGARVEARRFTTMRNYLLEYHPDDAHGVFGSYMAGFVSELLDEYTSALRYYDEVIQFRELKSLKAPVARLAALSPYRGKKLTSFLKDAPPPPARPQDPPTELLVVVSAGRVPYKVPERMPIGAAVGLAGTFITGDPKVLGYTATKFVIYPKMVPSGSLFTNASLRINGRSVPIELASNIGSEIKAEYEKMLPKIIGAAISRLIVRAAAAEGARAAGKSGGGSEAELVGFIAALLTEGALAAADKPDTRSWMFLPHWVYIHRHTLTPGKHEVEIDLSGGAEQSQTFSFELKKGERKVLVVTAPR